MFQTILLLQDGFSELTVLIPGVTLTSAPAITYFLLSIPIVLVMHEGAHGIVAALEKIKIKDRWICNIHCIICRICRTR